MSCLPTLVAPLPHCPAPGKSTNNRPMFWLLRKLLIPAAAFAFGYAAHWQLAVDACDAAGGTYGGHICVGDGK